MSSLRCTASTTVMANCSRFLCWPRRSSDGSRFAGADNARPEVIQVLHTTGVAGPQLVGHTAGVNAARWSPTEYLIATASWDGTVRLWSATGQEVRATRLVEEGSVEGVGWSPRGECLAAA
jgi:WD40 repeat protein